MKMRSENCLQHPLLAQQGAPRPGRHCLSKLHPSRGPGGGLAQDRPRVRKGPSDHRQGDASPAVLGLVGLRSLRLSEPNSILRGYYDPS